MKIGANSINQVWPRTCSDLVGRTLGGGKGGTAQVIFYQLYKSKLQNFIANKLGRDD